MHIPHDVVDLIIDQLFLSTDCEAGHPGHLQAASLVSTAWVNRSQHHLFSTLEFDSGQKVKRWCSIFKPDHYGVSRHVRVLIIGCRDPTTPTPPLLVTEIEAAFPHFTSFKNLQKFIQGYPSSSHTPPSVFLQILSSSAGTLKTLKSTHCYADMRKAWENIRTLADLLPNLTCVALSGSPNYGGGALVRFSADEGHSHPIKRLTIHELHIAHVVPLSFPFFDSCGPHLQVLNLETFDMSNPSER